MSLEQILCPPGDGVYTVHTAREYKESLQKLLYGGTTDIKAKWQNSINNPQHSIGIFGIPSDNGGGILRGANWGPLFIRESLYKSKPNLELTDFGDVRVIPHLLHDKYLNEHTIKLCQDALYSSSDNKLPVSPLSIAEKALDIIYSSNKEMKILGLGGDHSISYPLLASYINSRDHNKIGIIHFDAHTDLLKSRLGIDLCFGTWTAHILPMLGSGAQIAQVGIRSTGKPKEYWQDKFGINQYWNTDVKNQGPTNIANRIIDDFNNMGLTEIYITFDIDCLDISIAGATGTPEADGLSLDEATSIIKTCANKLNITGCDIAEVAPFTCTKSDKVDEPLRTLHSATTIASTLLESMGARI